MNLLKRLIIPAVLAIGLAGLGLAQTAGPTGGKLVQSKHANQRRPLLDALAKVNLTPDQQKQVKALVKARSEDMKAFRKANVGDRKAMREHNATVMKNFLGGIKGILTPDQWTKFQAELAALRANRKAGNKKATPPA